MILRIALVLVVAALLGPTAASEVLEPETYRTSAYRSPVPSTLSGARTVSVREAADLWRSGEAAFIDVMSRPVKPPGLPKGTLWRDPKRHGIPGSVWLPNTGYGALSADVAAYLHDGLEHATGGDIRHPVVIYCLQDCWMSWNAAKRAVSLGYEAVIWFSGGTDDWQAAGLPLEVLQPFEPGRR